MYPKYVFLACVICAASGFEIPKVSTKMKTNIFYETLDQNSINFFTNKFQVYYDKIQDFVDVHLVPFGKAQLIKPSGAGAPTITCEHGDVECYGNKVHACALSLLTKNEDEIEFVVCTMNNTDPKTVTQQTYPTKKCIDLIANSDLTMDRLGACVANNESMSLLEKYADETKQLHNINNLPVITLNSDPFDAQLSSDLVNDFQGVLCQKLANVPGISAVCQNSSTTTPSPIPTTPTTLPNSASFISTTYWPLFLAIVLTALFEVKLRY